MFKKNERYKQLDIFAINAKLNKNQQKLWNKSKEHCFFTEVFSKIDESLFSVLYSCKKSRPNTPVNQLVGALILKHLYDWTFEELFVNLNFNLLTRHAIGINTLDENVFCEASIFNFQNKLLEHLNTQGEDLMEKVFCQLTADQIKAFGVDTSIQRGDSFLVGSNIVDYCRLQLLIEIIIRLNRILDDSDLIMFNDELSVYTKYTSSNYIYRVNKKDLPSELEKLGNLYAKLYFTLGNQYKSNQEYINFIRVFEEQFKLEGNREVRVKPPKELHSGVLMSPDDVEATFRSKNKEPYKGYVTHISETVNPENKVNLITDVDTQTNNVSDSGILENRLPIMIDRTPDIAEYFVDGLYGSPKVDQITKRENIKLCQKTTCGRKSKAGIKIEQDESLITWVTCKGGQQIQATVTKKKGFKGVFDPEVCSQCPHQTECSLKQLGTKAKRRVIYFDKKKILIHKRLSNIEKLEKKKKYSRANVEATVKEVKRGIKNGKLRIRGWSRVSMHMILTVIAINLTRIHKEIGETLLFLVTSFHKTVQRLFMHKLLRYVQKNRIP